MKQKIAPYINFQGRAREAMELYQDVLGGKLELYAALVPGSPVAGRSDCHRHRPRPHRTTVG